MKLYSILLLFTFSLTAYSNSCIMENYHDEVIDTGTSLSQIAQEALLKNQCKVFRKENKRRNKNRKSKLSDKQFNRAKVLCGKWTFLNLGMRTNIGVPVALLKAIENFKEVGPKLKNLGLLDDETWSKKRWPFGIVKSKHQKRLAFKRVTTNKIVQFSCAACHTGKLPDGRVSIGMANESFEYGKFNQYTLFSIWMVDKRKYDETRWLPELIKMYKKLKKGNKSFFLKMMTATEKMPINKFLLKYIIGEQPPSLATQRSFLNSEPGVFNGFAPSLNFEDRELYVSAPGVWKLGTEKESHYGTLASRPDTTSFIQEAFVYTNRSNKYSKPSYIEPVAEYLKCLKSPKPIVKKNVNLYDRGQNVFKNSCTSCHDLKHGGGSSAVSPEAIGIPQTFVGIFEGYQPQDIQSKRTFKLLQEMKLDKSAHKIKVRRLNGVWTRKNLTSNGQIKGMDHLFCLNGKTRSFVNSESSKTQGIHLDLCENYSESEKEALKEYLKFF